MRVTETSHTSFRDQLDIAANIPHANLNGSFGTYPRNSPRTHIDYLELVPLSFLKAGRDLLYIP